MWQFKPVNSIHVLMMTIHINYFFADSSSVDENIFKANLQNIFSEQNKLVVQKRLSSLGSIPRGVNIKEDARSASVLIPLCTVNGVPSLLFMVRPMTMPQHGGEVW